MQYKIASTVLLTTKCSGGCLHCPFSSPKMERLFLSREDIKKMLDAAGGNLSVLSGGEPFEHPEIYDILTDLDDQTHPFRIATGGVITV